MKNLTRVSSCTLTVFGLPTIDPPVVGATLRVRCLTRRRWDLISEHCAVVGFNRRRWLGLDESQVWPPARSFSRLELQRHRGRSEPINSRHFSLASPGQLSLSFFHLFGGSVSKATYSSQRFQANETRARYSTCGRLETRYSSCETLVYENRRRSKIRSTSFLEGAFFSPGRSSRVSSLTLRRVGVVWG